MEKSLPIQKKDSWKLFDQIAGTYDLANRVLSLGIDTLWRKKLIKLLPNRNNLRVLDLATGTADVPLTLIKSPKIDFIEGIDLSKQMIEVGKAKILKQGLENKISLNVDDGVAIIRLDKSVDVITLSFGVRNFSDIELSMRNMERVLKDDGKVMIMEFGLPKIKLLKFLYLFYFRKVLPLIGNLLSNHPYAYNYLNQTVETFPYGESFADLMRRNGFKNVKVHTLSFGIAYIYEGQKR